MSIDQKRISQISAACDKGVLEKDKQKAAEILFAAWLKLLKILNEEGIASQKDAEEKIDWQFGNWINDIDEALFNAKRYEDEIELCRFILTMEWDQPLFLENARRSIADCYATMGNTAQALELFKEYLHDDPRWDWGWIGYFALAEKTDDPRFINELDWMYGRVQTDPAHRDAEDV